MTGIQLFDVAGQGMRFGQAADGTPYVVASDYAKALGYRDARDAARLLDDAEKGTQIVRTPGGDQRMTVFYEDGMWELIFRSTLPGAKAIKARVKAILREIRETGRYAGEPRFEIPQTYAAALELAAKQAREIEQRDEALAVAGPKAEAWDVLASADGDYSVREAAFVLNRDPAISTGQGRLFQTLREFGVIDRRNRPYASHERHARLRIREYSHPRTGETALGEPQVRITVAGLQYLHKRMGGTAPLDLQQQLPI